MRVLFGGLFLAGLAVLTLVSGGVAADDFKLEPGFTLLFNGKDLSGWKLKGGDSLEGKTESPTKRFVVIDGNLVIDPKSLKLYDGDVLGGTVSDNAFSVPATKGCGLFGPLADWRSGVPSAGGQNSTTQQMYLGAKTYGQGVSKAGVPGLSTLMADERD